MYTNIFAYTAPGSNYPEFLSINKQDDGTITIDVRSPPSFDVMQSDHPPLAVCGPAVRMPLPRDQVAALIAALQKLS